MGKFSEFTHIDGTKVLLNPGSISFGPELAIENLDETIVITIDSSIYETQLGEFMVNTSLPSKHQEVADKVIAELSSHIESVGQFKKITMKPDFKSRLVKRVNEACKIELNQLRELKGG